MTLLAKINAELEARAENGNRAHLGGSLIGRKCYRQLWYSFRWANTEKFNGRMLRLFERGHKEEFRFVNYLKMAGINVRAYSQRLLWRQWDWGITPETTIAGDKVDPSHCEYQLIPWEDDDWWKPDLAPVDVTDDPLHVERAAEQGVKLSQWRIKDVNGHFGGSLDGLADADFDVEVETVTTGRVSIPAGEEFLLEFKTHNTKSFVNLINVGVREAKPEHWAQMQIYMHKRQLKHALYMAVNKNDDDLYLEIVAVDPAEGPKLLEKASEIINAPKPPPRIGNNPSWYDCKFCPRLKICHYAEPMEKNCRTCQFAKPVENGQWQCTKWNAIIPSDVLAKGCDNGYIQITD
jgi:hypothetical protein